MPKRDQSFYPMEPDKCPSMTLPSWLPKDPAQRRRPQVKSPTQEPSGLR